MDGASIEPLQRLMATTQQPPVSSGRRGKPRLYPSSRYID